MITGNFPFPKKLIKWSGAAFMALSLLSPLARGQELTFKDHGKAVKTIKTSDMAKIVPEQTVTVWDPNAAKEITYKAYPLDGIMDAAYGKKWRARDVVQFTCLDGYQPTVPVSRFKTYKAMLAIERTDSPGDFSIMNQTEGGKKVSVGPYYLIWDNRTHGEIKSGDGAQWPYLLKTVDLVTFNDLYPKVAPPENSSAAAKRGFEAFQKNCITCHSLNGQGGQAGPELNYPVNITEYYKISWLKKWILDPTSIRYRTGMPGLAKDVPRREAVVSDIIEYFKSMTHKKLKPENSKK